MTPLRTTSTPTSTTASTTATPRSGSTRVGQASTTLVPGSFLRPISDGRPAQQLPGGQLVSGGGRGDQLTQLVQPATLLTLEAGPLPSPKRVIKEGPDQGAGAATVQPVRHRQSHPASHLWLWQHVAGPGALHPRKAVTMLFVNLQAFHEPTD